MSTFKLRPKFDMISEKPMDEIIKLVNERCKNNTYHLSGLAILDQISIWIEKSHRKYWSPQLSILMYPHDEGRKTRLLGTYGPMPTVWTFFMFLYIAIGVLVTFITIIGFAQKSLGNDASILWTVPILLLIALGLYIFSQMGQKLAAHQMYSIHFFFQEIIQEEVPEV
ncbi:MAG TPA: hypothetical protein PKD85_15370 [Saprospiraceae bacterium]|nr:hypothetical protein [Saprospiraceae bacterium]